MWLMLLLCSDDCTFNVFAYFRINALTNMYIPDMQYEYAPIVHQKCTCMVNLPVGYIWQLSASV